MGRGDSRKNSRAEPFSAYALLSAAVIGGLVGVVMTLAFAPLVMSGEAKIDTLQRTPGPTASPTSSTSPTAVRVAVERLARSSLGYTTSGQQRVTGVAVSPMSMAVGADSNLFDATITFALNPNPFGPSFGIRSAKDDVFVLLKALYSHNVPLGNVVMRGIFQFPGAKHANLVLLGGSSLGVEAEFAPWMKAPRSLEKKVWTVLHPHWISKRFGGYRPSRH